MKRVVCLVTALILGLGFVMTGSASVPDEPNCEATIGDVTFECYGDASICKITDPDLNIVIKCKGNKLVIVEE